MKLWIGVTDGEWFEFLRQRSPDEVNFWQPSGARQFRVLEPGGLFLFKLHSPRNYIAGRGFFVRHSTLPCSMAWTAFGEKNGVADLARFRTRIQKYRRSERVEPDPVVGHYYAHQGQSLLVMPESARDRPDPAFLRWHNDSVYARGGAVPSTDLGAT